MFEEPTEDETESLLQNYIANASFEHHGPVGNWHLFRLKSREAYSPDFIDYSTAIFHNPKKKRNSKILGEYQVVQISKISKSRVIVAIGMPSQASILSLSSELLFLSLSVYFFSSDVGYLRDHFDRKRLSIVHVDEQGGDARYCELSRVTPTNSMNKSRSRKISQRYSQFFLYILFSFKCLPDR